MRRLLLLPAFSIALAALPSARAAPPWPEVALPPGLQTVDVGRQMTVDGMPMRVRGFLSPEPADRLAALFRASLGSPLVESRHGAKTILGRAQGNNYLTVQIEPAGSGARGLIALTDVAGMIAGAADKRAERAQWQARLPAGMRIMRLLHAHDAGRASQHLVLESPQALAASRDALTTLLRQDGYTPGRIVASSAPPGEVLYFQGPGRDAMAVLTRNGDGATGIVLSIASDIGRPQ
jgi:hypothetical protein